MVACATSSPGRGARLGGVRSWAIQLQGLERPEAIARLRGAAVDLLVLEPMRSMRGGERFPMRPLVCELQAQGKLCLAYLNVGQAEDYRTYWQPAWRRPQRDQGGEPSFLLTVDPDGWEGNYPVAYWDARWRPLLWGAPHCPLDQILADGFDGVFLDWVLGFAETNVVAAARAAGVDPAAAMVALLADLRAYAQTRRPGFLLVAQNAVDLGELEPRVVDVVDGVAQESMSFGGRAGAAWDDPAAGDTPAASAGPWSTMALGARLQALRRRGLPVFTLDYAARPENAARARQASRAFGLVPCISRAPLDRLPP